MAGDPRLAGAVVVAAAQLPYSKRSTSPVLRLLIDVFAEVASDVELDGADIDGLAVSSFELAPDNVVTVAEQLGVELRWAWQGAHGGASGVASVIAAAEAVTSGRASAVVCASADAFSVASHMALMDKFNNSMQTYLAPYGFGATNGIFALVECAHRERYGTSREALGAIATTQRSHASLNPNALLRAPLSLDEYLDARIIADPIRLYDCVMPCTGADAVLVISRDIAARLGVPGIPILAGEQRHNAFPNTAVPLQTGAALYADTLFSEAGVSRQQLDYVQLYDDYPIMVAIQMEDLGLAPRGEVDAFLRSADLSLSGELPLNTGGGQLSCGQAGASGGMIGMFEAVTQSLGRAGSRQIKSPSVGLVNGFGMVGYARGLSSAGLILGGVE